MENELNIANDSLNKGLVRDNKSLIAWDCVVSCDFEQCPIANTCVYKKNEGDKCKLQVEYLQAFTNMIFSTYRYLNDDMLYKVGMQLIPLYSMLCRQKIVEKSVGQLAYFDAKGIVRIHPIYKEIRETMKVIAVISKEIGFTEILNPDLPRVGREGFGDINHYEEISKNADNKRNVIR